MQVRGEPLNRPLERKWANTWTPSESRILQSLVTAPVVGLLLHKTDSNLQKLPAPTHFSRRYA